MGVEQSRQMTEFEKEIYQKYYYLVQTVAKRKLHHLEFLEDAIQSTFLLYIKEQEKINNSLSSWFYWASVNVCDVINREESKNNKVRESLIQEDSEEAEESRNHIILDKVFAALSGKKKEMLLMRYYDGCTYKEIGSRFNCKEDSVRKTIERTILFLKKRFNKKDVLFSAFIVQFFGSQKISSVSIALRPPGSFVLQNSMKQQTIVKGVTNMYLVLKAKVLVVAAIGLTSISILAHEGFFVENKAKIEQEAPVDGENRSIKESKQYFTYEPWVNTNHYGDYFSLTREPDGKIAHWKMLNLVISGKDNKEETIYKSVGVDLRSIPRFSFEDGKKPLIKNDIFKFYEHHKPRIRPIITRTACSLTEDGYFATFSIGGEYYAKGGTELLPQMFYSKTGEMGSWENLGVEKMDAGVVKGNLEYFIANYRKMNKQFRFETSSVIKIKDTFYYYVQSPKGVGTQLSVLTTKDFRGAWKILGGVKNPIDLTKSLKKDVTWIFPAVLDLKEKGFLLVGGSKWPASEIYAAHSTDGIKFKMISDQPILTIDEIKKYDPSAKYMKSFRGVYNSDGTFEVGVSVDNGSAQVMYVSKTKFPWAE